LNYSDLPWQHFEKYYFEALQDQKALGPRCRWFVNPKIESKVCRSVQKRRAHEDEDAMAVLNRINQDDGRCRPW
jgi:hypothetical protein